ncbi:sugar kinase [Actinomadura sp. NPDC047616]|uniref:sugar kinase n=1 Tax=Actinomadura sp. NPDC047616 TaxID=3155914 RepID=UPI0033C5F676
MNTAGLVTLGETMAVLTPAVSGRPGPGNPLRVGIGGAESNVAVAVSRLGAPGTWIGRVGDDDLGRLVVRELRAEGVRVLAEVDPHAPTGLLLKELRGGRPRRVRYYRTGSAGSRLSPTDVDRARRAIADAGVLHLTGITAALGPQPRAALARATQVARDAGTRVSFDLNHRRTLWPDAAAAPVLRDLAASADVVFAGAEEAALILGRPAAGEATVDDGRELAAALLALGPGTAVVKLGALGAVAAHEGGVAYAPARAVTVVDPVGAGDAFAGGYLAELLRGMPPDVGLRTGNAMGAVVTATEGDWEGLPTRAELAEDLQGEEVMR